VHKRVQVAETTVSGAAESDEGGGGGNVRHVLIRRQDGGGLGLSLKGGVDVAPHMPVLISNLHKIDIG
jgi:hypothetical protein